MKSPLALLLLIFCLGVSAEIRTFGQGAYSFTVDLPKGWRSETVDKPKVPAGLLAEGPDGAKLLIGALVTDKNFNAFKQVMLAAMRQKIRTGVRELPCSYEGASACKLAFEQNSRRGTQRCLQIVVKRGRTVWVILLVVPGSGPVPAEPERAADSFRLAG